MLATAYGIMWSGVRDFEGHPMSVPLMLAGAAIWLIACQVEDILRGAGRSHLVAMAAIGHRIFSGAADEAPGAYKRLDAVLAAHGDTIEIVHRLTPLGVAMAGADTFDPYKD